MERPQRDIERDDPQMQRLWRTLQLVQADVGKLGIEFLNKMDRGPRDHQTLRWRDGVYQRAESLSVLLEILLVRREFYRSGFATAANQMAAMRMSDVSTSEQYALFDSIVFHSVSLIDYSAHLAGHVCVDREMKWNTLHEWAKGDAVFANTHVARAVRGLHRKWINKLHAYRSTLIHEKPDSGPGSLTMTTTNPRFHDWLEAPRKLVGTFSPLRSLARTNGLSLAWAGYWLCDCTLRSTKLLIDELRIYMEVNRNYGHSEELYRLSDGPLPMDIERLSYDDLLPGVRDPDW